MSLAMDMSEVVSTVSEVVRDRFTCSTSVCEEYRTWRPEVITLWGMCMGLIIMVL